MKIDVSYTEHSHIIGREGLSIKRIMEETECHVHFPDSNRSNPFEKSNQVSIAGDIKGVEMARSRVRVSICFRSFRSFFHIFNFCFKAKNANNFRFRAAHHVQRFRPKMRVHSEAPRAVQRPDHVQNETEIARNSCGNQGGAMGGDEGQRSDNAANRVHLQNLGGIFFTKLCFFLTPNWCVSFLLLKPQISVQMLMEISPHHHQMVIGINHANLKSIIKATGVEIMFPDAQDPNIPNLKKSRVTITGHIDNVYAAREMLMVSLAVLLFFYIQFSYMKSTI